MSGKGFLYQKNQNLKIRKQAMQYKWAKDVTTCFAKEDVRRANKLTEKNMISSVTREPTIKTMIRYQYIPIRMAQTKHPQALRPISHGHLGLAQSQSEAVGTSEEGAVGAKSWTKRKWGAFGGEIIHVREPEP